MNAYMDTFTHGSRVFAGRRSHLKGCRVAMVVVDCSCRRRSLTDGMAR